MSEHRRCGCGGVATLTTSNPRDPSHTVTCKGCGASTKPHWRKRLAWDAWDRSMHQADLVDIRKRLDGASDSVLTGDHGLAAATYRQAMAVEDRHDARVDELEAEIDRLHADPPSNWEQTLQERGYLLGWLEIAVRWVEILSSSARPYLAAAGTEPTPEQATLAEDIRIAGLLAPRVAISASPLTTIDHPMVPWGDELEPVPGWVATPADNDAMGAEQIDDALRDLGYCPEQVISRLVAYLRSLRPARPSTGDKP